MLSADQIKKVATLVNNLIDVPIVPEFLEQQVFEAAVTLIDKQLDQLLPAKLKDFLNDATMMLDDAHTGDLADRLVAILNKSVDIPLLNDDQEQKVFRIVIDLIIRAMASKKTLDGLLPA